MKFTKEQLLDALKAKLTANGKHLSVSDKTIKSMCDNHYSLLVNDETELEDLVGKILPVYVSLNGNYEKDNADFIKKWNDEHPTGKPQPKDGENNVAQSQNLEALIAEVNALKDKEARREAENAITLKRNELLSAFKEKGIKDEKWTKIYLSKLNLSGDTDVEKETADALDFYNISHVKGGDTPGSADTDNDGGNITAKRWSGVNKALGSKPSK